MFDRVRRRILHHYHQLLVKLEDLDCTPAGPDHLDTLAKPWINYD